jgi:hypothetical protein
VCAPNQDQLRYSRNEAMKITRDIRNTQTSGSSFTSGGADEQAIVTLKRQLLPEAAELSLEILRHSVEFAWSGSPSASFSECTSLLGGNGGNWGWKEEAQHALDAMQILVNNGRTFDLYRLAAFNQSKILADGLVRHNFCEAMRNRGKLRKPEVMRITSFLKVFVYRDDPSCTHWEECDGYPACVEIEGTNMQVRPSLIGAPVKSLRCSIPSSALGSSPRLSYCFTRAGSQGGFHPTSWSPASGGCLNRRVVTRDDCGRACLLSPNCYSFWYVEHRGNGTIPATKCCLRGCPNFDTNVPMQNVATNDASGVLVHGEYYFLNIDWPVTAAPQPQPAPTTGPITSFPTSALMPVAPATLSPLPPDPPAIPDCRDAAQSVVSEWLTASGLPGSRTCADALAETVTADGTGCAHPQAINLCKRTCGLCPGDPPVTSTPATSAPVTGVPTGTPTLPPRPSPPPPPTGCATWNCHSCIGNCWKPSVSAPCATCCGLCAGGSPHFVGGRNPGGFGRRLLSQGVTDSEEEFNPSSTETIPEGENEQQSGGSKKTSASATTPQQDLQYKLDYHNRYAKRLKDSEHDWKSAHDGTSEAALVQAQEHLDHLHTLSNGEAAASKLSVLSSAGQAPLTYVQHCQSHGEDQYFSESLSASWTPTLFPTNETAHPSWSPTPSPTPVPSSPVPTPRPSPLPTRHPTPHPTRPPTRPPTRSPTRPPTRYPTRTGYILGSDGSDSCRAGLVPVVRSECIPAATAAGAAVGRGLWSRGDMVVGHYSWCPPGCYVHKSSTVNEIRPHWNTNTNGHNDGRYQMVCKT